MGIDAAMQWVARWTASAGSDPVCAGPNLLDRMAAALGIAWVTILAGLGGAVAVGLLLVIRERRHRRHVSQLFIRLGELEELWSQHDSAEEPELLTPLEPPSSSRRSNQPPITIRGRFSSVISSLRRRSKLPSTEPQRIDLRAIRHLYAHLEKQTTPSELASDLHVSLRTLQRQVTATLGCSPRDLIVAVKMHEAKRLLTSGGLQVGEAARAVGFEDAFHFSKRFRAYYGVPPSQVRVAA